MEILLWTLVIFFARVVDVSLGTIRVQFIVRRKKLLAAATGFIEVLIFIVIVSRVIQDIQHWPYVLAYAGGFATGTLLGMFLSEKLSHRAVHTTVICNGSREELEAALREAGFALTRYDGSGRDGPVAVLDVICTATSLPHLLKVVRGTDPKAFFFTQELSALQGGYVLGLKSKL
ncbi:MAG: DUF2179 domain-containing protein [Anaerolineae bacterium]|jgi:uncharacterized protein YebE (UPF0316 family)